MKNLVIFSLDSPNHNNLKKAHELMNTIKTKRTTGSYKGNPETSYIGDIKDLETIEKICYFANQECIIITNDLGFAQFKDLKNNSIIKGLYKFKISLDKQDDYTIINNVRYTLSEVENETN